jgi:hypothetical protein
VPMGAVGSAEVAVELKCRSRCYFSQDDVSRTTWNLAEGYDKQQCYVGLNLTQLQVHWVAAVRMGSVVAIVVADIA